MTDTHARILIVEDEPDTRSNLVDILDMFGFDTAAVGSGEEALARSDLANVDVIVLDRRLPDVYAEDLLPQLQALAPTASVIIATGYGDLDSTIGALRHGASDYLIKPINPDALHASIDRCLERKRLERARQQSEAAFRNLVESAGSIIVIVRPDRTVAYLNPFGEQFTGRPLDSVVGLDCINTFLGHQDSRPYETLFRRILRGNPVPEFELEVVCEHERRHWLVCNARCLDDYEGDPAVLIIGQDITARRDAEHRLLRSERLAAIGKAMAGLAHESRNALQRSQASLDMLSAELADNEFAMKLIQRIQTAQNDLHRLYEDVREYARPININATPCDVTQLLRQAWDELIVEREGRDTSLHITVETDSTECPAEAFQLRQVFRNILDNALAACEDPVVIQVLFSDQVQDSGPALGIRIHDNGPGVDAAAPGSVFDEFVTTKTHGTGLGLAIVQRTVEAHGGRIALSSDVAAGFALDIMLPRRSVADSADSDA